MRNCGNCFRFIENWRDAKEKGYNERITGFAQYNFKPRKGIKPHCSCGGVKNELHAKHEPCEYHQYRWSWNLHIWYQWRFKHEIRNAFRRFIKVPLGGLRKPLQIGWRDYYNGMSDTTIEGGEPLCPRCGEMPYSYGQCVFCGQRFIQRDGEG